MVTSNRHIYIHAIPTRGTKKALYETTITRDAFPREHGTSVICTQVVYTSRMKRHVCSANRQAVSGDGRSNVFYERPMFVIRVRAQTGKISSYFINAITHQQFLEVSKRTLSGRQQIASPLQGEVGIRNAKPFSSPVSSCGIEWVSQCSLQKLLVQPAPSPILILTEAIRKSNKGNPLRGKHQSIVPSLIP
jgi:hypothetical protein